MKTYIRTYRTEDKLSLFALLELNTPRFFAEEEHADFERYLKEDLEYHYVLCGADDTILGCGGFTTSEDGETAKLSWDFLHPDFQGFGFGSALTRHRIARIKQLPGIKKVSVRTSQHVYPFYEKFGLVVREIVPDYWAPGFDMYRLDNTIDAVK